MTPTTSSSDPTWPDPPQAQQPGWRQTVPLHGTLAGIVEIARAAPRVWAWWPMDGGPPRVSGRPPPDGVATDTAALLITLLRRAHGDALTPALQAQLRQAQQRDGSLRSVTLLRVVAPLLPLH